MDFTDRRGGIGCKQGGAVRLGGRANIDQMMRYPRLFGARRLGATDIEPPVDKRRVCADDFPVESLGKLERERGLAGGRGPCDNDNGAALRRRNDLQKRKPNRASSSSCDRDDGSSIGPGTPAAR